MKHACYIFTNFSQDKGIVVSFFVFANETKKVASISGVLFHSEFRRRPTKELLCAGSCKFVYHESCITQHNFVTLSSKICRGRSKICVFKIVYKCVCALDNKSRTCTVEFLQTLRWFLNTLNFHFAWYDLPQW